MLKTYYVVLDEYSLVEHEEDGTTALFESEEVADRVADFLMKSTKKQTK